MCRHSEKEEARYRCLLNDSVHRFGSGEKFPVFRSVRQTNSDRGFFVGKFARNSNVRVKRVTNSPLSHEVTAGSLVANVNISRFDRSEVK